MTIKEITLLVPGLRRFEEHGFRELSATAGRLPALELIMARGRKLRLPGNNLDRTLGSFFGLSLAAESSLPVAALAHSLQYETPADHWYMHCDPVLIQPNRDHLLLVGNDMLDYTEREAQQIVNDINATYRDQSWQIKMLSTRQWVLEMQQAPDLQTHPLNSVVGRKINAFLPHGRDATAWHALMNELQMLLHSHPLNQSRAMRGEVAANSIWFWGEGHLPALTNDAAAPRWAQCWANHVPTLALAKLSDTPRIDLPATADIWMQQAITTGHHLVLIDSLDLPSAVLDPVLWWQQLSQLDAQWFMPLVSALRRSGALSKLTLSAADGWSYELTAGMTKHWWKRVKAIV